MTNQDELALGRSGAWTDEETKQLHAWRQAGLSAKAIASAMGRTHQSVAMRISGLQKRHAAETARARRSWSVEDVDILETMLGEGATYDDIARQLKRTNKGVQQWVAKMRKEKQPQTKTAPKQIFTKPMPQPEIKPINLSPTQPAWSKPEPQTHRNAAWAAVAVAAGLAGFILGGLAQ
jgi:DNA-binding NarL/FixJ family response regulator